MVGSLKSALNTYSLNQKKEYLWPANCLRVHFKALCYGT
jgi:hypothetical protein